MCTAATYQTNDFYFGRTLDYESSYGEEIVIVPRQFRLSFLHMGVSAQHYAMIGTAHVAQGYPLFYDAVNEKGLCMAGLNFVGNACYASRPADHSDNVAHRSVETLLVHCYGGQSRSRAVGAFAVEMLGGNSERYFETGSPNQYVYDVLETAWIRRQLGAL